MKTARNFKSQADYKKWLAYGHMHGEFAKSPGNTPVKIQGKSHKVSHMKPGGPNVRLRKHYAMESK